MVLSITAGSKDDDSGISILKIKSSNGKCTTPMRTVNRNDVSAKDALGSSIHLAKNARSFFYELPINMNDVLNILQNPKYSEKYEKKILDLMDRFKTSDSLFFLYITATKEANQNIIQNDLISLYVHRICELTKNIDLEYVLLPTFGKIETVSTIIQKHDLQYIPLINIKNDLSILEKEFDIFNKFDCSNSPMLGINFCPCVNLEEQYKKLIKRFDDWHEKNKGIITIGAERKMQSCDNVSGVHYPAIIYGDLIVEGFSRYFGDDAIKKQNKVKALNNKNNPKLTWFDKDELKFSKLDNQNIDNFLNSRKTGIYEDHHNKDLLIRIVNNELTFEDVKNRRETYLNRLDENNDSRTEFEEFQKYVSNNEVKHYRESKQSMNNILKKHFKSFQLK